MTSGEGTQQSGLSQVFCFFSPSSSKKTAFPLIIPTPPPPLCLRSDLLRGLLIDSLRKWSQINKVLYENTQK